MAEDNWSFRQQYPLSPRKFWKKMIQKFLPMAILFGVTAIFVVLIALVGSDTLGAATYIKVISLTVLGFIVVLMAAMSLYAWYVKAYIARYYYDCSEHFITIRKRVFTPREIHVQYQKIQDVYVDQDIWDRILGIYDVHIASATASSGMEAHIDGVSKETAEALKNLLLQMLQPGAHPSSGTGGMSANAPAPAAHRVELSSEVSSRTYPISGKWVVVRIAQLFISQMFGAFILVIYLFSGLKDVLATAIIAALLLLIPIGSFCISVISVLIWKKNFRFELLPEYFKMHVGIISRQESHVPYRNIQDVIVTQSVLGRLFGLCDVAIQNAVTSAPVRGKSQNTLIIPGQTLEKGKELVEIINAITSQINSTASSQSGL